MSELEPLPAVQSDYRIDIGVFQGPLDLLLYLIQKEEVDIADIPVARITSEYLRYLDVMTTLNLEVAGEFILMAATLIRIKTRMLLPRDEQEDAELDPRNELMLALIEYKKFKEAGGILRERALEEERLYVPPSPISRPETRVELKAVTTLYDLVSAFQAVIANRRAESFHEVTAETVSIQERAAAILLSLTANERLTFEDLFADVPRKIVAVVTFIALLELVRTRRIMVHQSSPFTNIWVYRGERFDAPHDRELDIAEAQTELLEEAS